MLCYVIYIMWNEKGWRALWFILYCGLLLSFLVPVSVWLSLFGKVSLNYVRNTQWNQDRLKEVLCSLDDYDNWTENNSSSVVGIKSHLVQLFSFLLDFISSAKILKDLNFCKKCAWFFFTSSISFQSFAYPACVWYISGRENMCRLE